jgi:hypothetical protein
MSWEVAWAEAAMARRFVKCLSELGKAESRPAIPPILHRDPYLSAWTNVEAARRAVRSLLARRWLLTPESLAFVYEPFESSVPLTSLA